MRFEIRFCERRSQPSQAWRLAGLTIVFEDADYLLIPSFREMDGEDRYKVIGMIDGKLWTAVHVRRDNTVRFISVRRSNSGEERQYRA